MSRVLGTSASPASVSRRQGAVILGGTPLEHVVWGPLAAAGRYRHRSCGPQRPSAPLPSASSPLRFNTRTRLLWLRTPRSCWRRIYPAKWAMPPSPSWAERGTFLWFRPGGVSLAPAEGAGPSPATSLEMVPKTCVEGGAAAAGEAFPAFPPSLCVYPCSLHVMLYRGGRKFAVGSVQRLFRTLQPVPAAGRAEVGGRAAGRNRGLFVATHTSFPVN